MDSMVFRYMNSSRSNSSLQALDPGVQKGAMFPTHENGMSAPAPRRPRWHRGLRRWPPYFPDPLGRCESRRHDRRHHVFTLNTSRNRHSMAPLAENGPCPKKVTHKALGASRDIWAASGNPPGVPTVQPSRRGQWSDVFLAHTHQYSTRPASASTTSHT